VKANFDDVRRRAVLVISDVVEDELETIGSAPLFCYRSTYRDFFDILRKIHPSVCYLEG